MTGIRDYSPIADDNLSVGGISIAEGWARASVNNSYRAGMADVADLLLDMGGSKVTTGTASAYLVDLDTEPTAYADNLLFLATAHVGNAADPTININSIGVKSIKRITQGIASGIVVGDFPAGHIGIFTYSSSNNAVILLNPGRGAGSEFDTVADLLANASPAEGEGTVWQADGFRYREADPAATDHHLTTAGGVKLYVLPGDDGWYNFLAMDPARDGVTNDADKLKKLLLIRPMGGVSPSNPVWVPGPSIQIPQGIYYMDAGPWGFQIKATTHIRGEGHSPDNDFRHTTLMFPKNVIGFMVNHFDTYENTVEDTPGYTGGAIGTTIERIALRVPPADTALGSNPLAHGIWAKTSVHLRDVVVYGFYGHGICITGSGSTGPYWVSGTNYGFNAIVKSVGKVLYQCTTDPGAGLSTIEPSHQYDEVIGADGYGWTPYLHGGPSGCSFNNIVCFYNHNCGIFIQGHDASVMAGFRVDVYANGRWGIYDDCFLGNTWVQGHSEGNGVAGRGGNPVGSSSIVAVNEGPGVHSIYYAKHTATPTELVTIPAGTDEDIWVNFRPHFVGAIGDPTPIWTAAQPVGTYFVGGSYYSGNAATSNTYLGCYSELSEGFGVLGPNALAIGGIANWDKGSASINATGGVVTMPNGVGVLDTFTNRVKLGGDTNTTASLFRALNYQSVTEASPWIWQYMGTTGDWTLQYGGSSNAHHLTSINTLNKMGTSKTQPYLMNFPIISIGNPAGNSSRRMTTAAAKPTTSEYAAGDIIWNTSTATNSYAGWVCTTAGVGASSAPAWVTGTNYALNAYILATGSKYYRCSVDPGGVILSTVEPSHSSGEVVGADGFGWTFVSSLPVEFLPFGQTIDLFEHTTTATLALSALTHPRIIVHSATVPTSATITLSTSGAFKGANFRITRTGGGAGVVNVGTGPLKALAASTWCEVTYDGSAWILTAYGAL
jgi:hypothetical protein